jgi:hypothetical protein
VLGLTIGGLSGLLMELLARRVRSVGDVVNGFDVPLLCVMTAPEDRQPQGWAARVRAFFWPRHGFPLSRE